MKKFIIEIVFFFFLPLSIIAVVAEYSLRNIPNDYAYKSSWMDNNSRNIEVLYLGPSTIFYDLDPAISKWKGFNASHVSQPLIYDHFIFNKYLDKMDSLKYVVLGVDYWSPRGTMKETTEWWRMKYYTIHYDCPYDKDKTKYSYELYFHNPETMTIAAKGTLRLLGLNNVSHLTVNEYGYGTNYTSDKRAEEWDNGQEEGERHNILISSAYQSDDIYHQNIDFIKDISKKCKDRGVKLILLGSPHYISYNNTIERKFIDDRDLFCESLASSHDNVYFINYSELNLFSADEYYDAMHLNEHGSRRFTELIDKELDNLSTR